MARKAKLKPTPISRLFKYKYPLPMVGDPKFARCNRLAWDERSRVVYPEMMVLKRGGWTDRMYLDAVCDNEELDMLIAEKWEDHDQAWEDAKWMDYENAVRDHATWEYEREYIGVGTPLECFDTAA